MININRDDLRSVPFQCDRFPSYARCLVAVIAKLLQPFNIEINRSFFIILCGLPCLRGWHQSASIDSSSPDKPGLGNFIRQVVLNDVFLDTIISGFERVGIQT